MKNTLNVVRNQLKVIIALGLLAILIIETIRGLTGFPTPTVGPQEQEGVQSPIEAWGAFAGQFAYFTVWTNILFVLTILFSWVFRIKINPYWRNAIATYLMIMLVVFFALIAPQIKWDKHWWITFILFWQHLGVVIIGLWWFFTTKTETKTKLGRSMLLTATIPAMYLGFAIAIYIAFKIVPYNFLNFKNSLNLNLPLFASISLAIGIIIGIGLLTILFSWIFTSANSWKAISVRRGKKGGKASAAAKRRNIFSSNKLKNSQTQTQSIKQMQEPEIIMEEITIEIPVTDQKTKPIKKKTIFLKRLSKNKKSNNQKKSSKK